MRIVIVGTGAMGTILGAILTDKGYDIELVDTYKEHVDALNEHGAKVIGTQEFTVPVKALTPDQMSGIYDLVILYTKQTANHIVLPHLLNFINDSSIVCTLQNGVPEPSVASYVGEERTIGGASNWSATFISPGVSELTQDLEKTATSFDLGEMRGAITPRVREVAKILEEIGRPAKLTDSLMESRYGKLVLNACVSGMSAVCGTTFGEVLENPVSRACVSHIGNEVKKVCEADGYKLPVIFGYSLDSLELKDQEMFEENQRMFMELYKPAWPGKASMLQDLEKGLPTEVKMINGFVSEGGRKHEIPTPFNDKVVEIVTKIEQGELTYSVDNLKLFPKELFPFKNLD